MTPNEFVKLCPTLWHVSSVGSWDTIRVHGFLTAQQIIDRAAIGAERRLELTTSIRRDPVELQVEGHNLTLRDQAPLLQKKDLESILEEGMTTADWIQLLNARVYFFSQLVDMVKLRDKYAATEGAVEVITVSPLRLAKAAGPNLELASQNTGAIARRTDRYKTWETFTPLASFPAIPPREVTVRGSVSDLDVVSSATRWYPDGRTERLSLLPTTQLSAKLPAKG